MKFELTTFNDFNGLKDTETKKYAPYFNAHKTEHRYTSAGVSEPLYECEFETIDELNKAISKAKKPVIIYSRNISYSDYAVIEVQDQ